MVPEPGAKEYVSFHKEHPLPSGRYGCEQVLPFERCLTKWASGGFAKFFRLCFYLRNIYMAVDLNSFMWKWPFFAKKNTFADLSPIQVSSFAE